MKSLLERYKEYIPNTSTDLAMVLVETVAPKQAFWPMRITQLIGGKTWSISLITHKPAEVKPPEERCDHWADGHSYRKCSQLKNHEGLHG